MRKIIIVCTFFLFASCSSDTKVDVLSFSSISGFAQTFNSSTSEDTVVMSCSTIEVLLYKLSSDGSKVLPHIAKTEVGIDGRYSFSDIQSEVNFNGKKPAEPYIVESQGCGKSYSRILTGNLNQDITFGTSLINFTIETCLLYTSPSPRDQRGYRMPSSA